MVTGSSVSILPKQLYQKNFAHCPLTKNRVKIVTYSRDGLSVLGCLHVTIFHEGVTAPAIFYTVNSGSALRAMDLIKVL